jgi:fatty-acyl-CoA synthase
VPQAVWERRRALEARYPRWQELTLAQALDRAAEEFGPRPLVIGEQRSYTYLEMQRWSQRLAAGLVAAGISVGEHVAVVMVNCPEYVALKFALACVGAVAVPINFLLRRDELRYVLWQSDAAALITIDRHRDLDYLAALDSLAPGWEHGGAAAALPALRQVFVLPRGGSGRAGARTFAELEELGGAEHAQEAQRRSAAADPRAVADIIYTSGTTGLPKGVMLTHDQLLRSAYGSALTRAFQDGRRILFALPLYHVFSYIEGLLAALFAGGAIIPQAQFDPLATLEAIERHRADEALFVPTMTVAVLEAARQASFDLSSLHAVMSAAAPAPVPLWEAVREELGVAEVITAYGMTETCAATTYTEPDGPLELVANTVGAPKRGGVAGDPELGGMLVAYRTVEPRSGAPLAPGAEGELVARGPIIAGGYYKKPEETAAALDPKGWLRSGDLGHIDAAGRLILTGRSKELYKCGGELVAPKEVEELLSRHEDVAQAYVVGVPDERMGEVGCAWVIPAGSVQPDPAALIAYCRERLARFKVPAHVLFMTAEELPLTATGKVQKFRLAQRAAERLTAAGAASGG